MMSMFHDLFRFQTGRDRIALDNQQESFIAIAFSYDIKERGGL